MGCLPSRTTAMHKPLLTLLLLAGFAAPAPALPAPLDQAMDQLRDELGFLDSLLVAQHGELVLEHYRRPEMAHQAHALRSAGKSLISAALGMALGEKKLKFVHAGVYDIFNHTGWIPQKARDERAHIRFHHVLTMTAGLLCPGPDAENNPCDPKQAKTAHPWREYLRQPMAAEPGTRFAYTDMAPLVIRTLIYAVSRRQADEVLSEGLFKPLGMADKANIGALQPRDMLRFGQLYLQQGCWDGHQLIPMAWVRASTAPQYRFPDSEGRAGYGYFWWWGQFNTGNERIEAYYAAGNGGQLVLVVPSLDAVIVTTGDGYDRMQDMRELLQQLARKLLPALKSPEPATATACGALKF